MGIIERKRRFKEDLRNNILKAALDIAKSEGWQAVSMRKIAVVIEYTAPAIYEYFRNKEAILLELCRLGFLRLARLMKIGGKDIADPKEQMQSIWLAYWNFAFAEPAYFRLMFGVGTPSCEDMSKIKESKLLPQLIYPVINGLSFPMVLNEEEIAAKFYAYWSTVHGLVAVNMVRHVRSEEFNRQVLKASIGGLSNAILTVREQHI